MCPDPSHAAAQALSPLKRGFDVLNASVEDRVPLGITPHKLRHTFASILVAIGKDPTYVMQQLGHTDPPFTLPVYSHTMRRSEDERARLKALVEGHDWAQIGHKTAESASMPPEQNAGR